MNIEVEFCLGVTAFIFLDFVFKLSDEVLDHNNCVGSLYLKDFAFKIFLRNKGL